MVRFRSSRFIVTLFIGCASSFAVLGCDENPVFPVQPGASTNLVANGSFERPRISGFEYDSYESGQSLDAWSIDAGAVEIGRAHV